jgi:branched-chain amino acid transport system substrate-binding protein
MGQLIGVITCCGLAVACARPAPPSAAQAPRLTPTPEADAKPAPKPVGPDVVIGAYLPVTGPEASFGLAVHNGIAIAVAEQNRAGGVRGGRIVMRTIDTHGRTSEAAAAVNRLATEERAVAILGEVTSRASLAGAGVAQGLGVPMIAPVATHPDITRVGDMISRACILDEAQAVAMASFARTRLKAARVAVLYDLTQPYSSGLATLFDQAFSRLGGTIATVQTFNGASLDVQAQLEAIRDAKVDAIFAPLYYAPAAVIARKLRELDVTAPMLGTDGWDSPELGKLAGAALDGSYYTSSFAAGDPRPIVQELVKQYRAKHGGDPDGLAALGYDSARLLFAAMTRARSLSGRDLAEAIGSTKGLQGATGTLTMGPDREPRKPVAVLQIKAGKPMLAGWIPPS